MTSAECESSQQRLARIVTNSGRKRDCEYAMTNANRKSVNGKQTAAVHRLLSTVADTIDTVILRWEDVPEAAGRNVDLEADRDAFDDWLSEHIDFPVHIEWDMQIRYPEVTTLWGPTLISTATLQEIVSWFDGLATHQMQFRLSSNHEVDEITPYWEDGLFTDHENYIGYQIGDVQMQEVNPSPRYIVLVQSPLIGVEYPEYQWIFREICDRALPTWADRARLDHNFRLIIQTNVLTLGWGEELKGGNERKIPKERKPEAAS